MRLRQKIRNRNRPVLCDSEIIRLNQEGLLVAQPLNAEQIQPNSVDLTLAGNWVSFLIPNDYDSTNGVINTANEIKYGRVAFSTGPIRGMNLIPNKPYYIIAPGEFCLMSSKEILDIPNGIIAFVQGRSSIARLGIQTEQAGLIDAGFVGTITFEVQNQTDYPIVLYEGTRIAQVWFMKAQYASIPYGENKGSKYFGQQEPTGSRLHLDHIGR